MTGICSAALLPSESTPCKQLHNSHFQSRHTANYHPVQIGDIPQHRYEVKYRLGYGGWSTVWQAYDLLEKQYVAVKIGIADSLPHKVKIRRPLATAGRYVWPKLAQAFEERVHKFRRDDDMGEFGAEETEAILEMMAQIRPEERRTVEQVLESRWMASWAPPNCRRAQVKS